MKLEDQVVSLELAKRLKELGITTESLYSWVYWPNASEANKDAKPTLVLSTSEMTKGDRASVAPAFTVAELGEMLPDDYASLKVSATKWWCGTREDVGTAQSDRKEADARAKMLIYLLENNLLSTPNPNTIG